MSLLQSNIPGVAASRDRERSKERGHHIRVFIAAAVSFVFLAAIGIYRASYYMLPSINGPIQRNTNCSSQAGALDSSWACSARCSSSSSFFTRYARSSRGWVAGEPRGTGWTFT